MGRRKNKRDRYGIYEQQEYSFGKKKKKEKFTIKSFIKFIVIGIFIIGIVYGAAFAIKNSMLQKGMTLYSDEDYEGASELFEEALKPRLPFLEQFDNNVRLYLAECYVNTGAYSEACYTYNMVSLWSDEKEEAYESLQNIAYGLQLYAWRDYRTALPILLTAYENGCSDLILYVGSCYGQMGDLDNMQLYYDVFLQNNEMNSFMYAQYAAIALDEGKLDEAFDYIEKGKQLEDQSNIQELLFDEIIYYEQMKDYNTAYKKARDFVEAYPNDADGKNEYDWLYTRQTESEK